MDIAGLSMNLAQTQLLNSVETAVLSQSLEQAKDLSANMVEMLDAAAMERSVNPDIGANIDIMIQAQQKEPRSILSTEVLLFILFSSDTGFLNLNFSIF